MGARFSAPVQTGPGAHPTSYTMGTGSFTGVKRPGRDSVHPPRSSAKVKERVELYLYSPFGAFVACYSVNVLACSMNTENFSQRITKLSMSSKDPIRNYTLTTVTNINDDCTIFGIFS